MTPEEQRGYDKAVRDISERLEAYLDGLPWYGPRAEAMVDVTLDGLITDLRDVVHPQPKTTRGPRRVDPDDVPTVCIAHGRFIPCRKQGEHRYSSNPYWVKSVRDYHDSPIEDLTWEPAWERKAVEDGVSHEGDHSNVLPPAVPAGGFCGRADCEDPRCRILPPDMTQDDRNENP